MTLRLQADIANGMVKAFGRVKQTPAKRSRCERGKIKDAREDMCEKEVAVVR